MPPGPLNKEVAKKVLFQLADLLDSIKLEFCLLEGTALGAYRDKDFCNGDKDIDIAVKHENLVLSIPKIVALLPSGVKWKTATAPYDYDRAMHLVWSGVRIDILDYALNSETGERFCANGRRNYSIVHPASTFETMQKVEFFGREFNIPTPIEEYLVREYGPSWRTPDPSFCVSQTRIYGYKGYENVRLV